MDFIALKEMVASSDNIVFFGGAGVSTESNIPDFKSGTGLYKSINEAEYPPEVILSKSFFMNHTEEFYEFYRNKMIYKDAKPNRAHLAMAELEGKGSLKAVITQNIDGLHHMAGSKNVLELHGSIHRNYCVNCSRVFHLDYVLESKSNIPICNVCCSMIKPDVVLYDEYLNTDLLNQAKSYIEEADILIVGGTSLTVHPAAGLVRGYVGSKLILINEMPTPYDGRANFLINDNIGKVLNALLSMG